MICLVFKEQYYFLLEEISFIASLKSDFVNITYELNISQQLFKTNIYLTSCYQRRLLIYQDQKRKSILF
jgi:hypothetical protein